jgi:large subunit ribosomal protein L24
MAKKTFEGKLFMRSGDTVIVLTGKDKGRTGKITKVYPKTGKLLVEGINIATKHEKGVPTPQNPQPEGVIKKVEAPILAAKVSLIGADGKATRVRTEVKDGKKIRVSAKTGEAI